MGRQQDRVAARVAIKTARAAKLTERRRHEAALEQLAVQVQVELRAGTRALADAERRAGALIDQMATAHGATMTQVADWCADGMTPREAGRLRRLATPQSGTPKVAEQHHHTTQEA